MLIYSKDCIRVLNKNNGFVSIEAIVGWIQLFNGISISFVIFFILKYKAQNGGWLDNEPSKERPYVFIVNFVSFPPSCHLVLRRSRGEHTTLETIPEIIPFLNSSI